ncbi:MAG: hypothetical protein NTY62_06120 [Euryarchaeota archaeon]|jgi:hypothetical protein|nr:hypothetical protein [Euryarchaeota archaeon]
MAKKLKKVRKNPLLLMIELLLPWVVMGGLAAILTSIGTSRESTIAFALAGGLGTTGLIFVFERRRRATRVRERNQRQDRRHA